jgi:tetratricopeptide (TPR) repeat protein
VPELPLEKLSRQELEQRLAHALAVGDEESVAQVDAGLSSSLLADGDVEGARRHAERAVALCREHGLGDALLARALEALGHAAKALGDPDAATGAYLEAIDLQSRQGEKGAVASLLGNLGGLAARAGDRDRARDLLGAALRGAADPSDDGRRRAELELAQIELEDGDDISAARRALRVLQGGAAGAQSLEAARLLQESGEAAARRGDDEVARRRYEFALPVVRREGTGDALLGMLQLLGATCRRAGDHAAARGYWQEAIELCAAAEAPDERLLDTRGALLHDLGEMCLTDEADPTAALPYLEEALEVSDATGALSRVVSAASALHRAAVRRGDVAAVERWRAVQARSGFAAGVARLAAGLVGGQADGGEPPTYVFGDTGGAPHTVRIPGGRVSDGVIWRRRLAAELRRAAPWRRVAVVRSVRRDSGIAVQLLVVDDAGVEARTAVVGGGLAPGGERWRRVVQPRPGTDRLVEALRSAMR